MKNIIFLLLISWLFFSCSATSPEDLVDDEPITASVTYNDDISPIVESQCLSCHNDNFMSGGNSYSSYVQFRDAVENGEVINRITRPVGDPEKMPQGGQLPDSSINLIIQWQADGYLEN
ncbi:hypothetical protein [Nonlabens xiamenensis]|uniref:hypothetical protein n=1 Tax=Nonlabens xiamenensis TaxID=2341043 RepID=UPI001F0BF87A|nr:hypothetical protein [Nonlabens xiamenensis]